MLSITSHPTVRTQRTLGSASATLRQQSKSLLHPEEHGLKWRQPTPEPDRVREIQQHNLQRKLERRHERTKLKVTLAMQEADLDTVGGNYVSLREFLNGFFVIEFPPSL